VLINFKINYFLYRSWHEAVKIVKISGYLGVYLGVADLKMKLARFKHKTPVILIKYKGYLKLV